MRKLLVIGLDSAPPELLFGEILEELPNIRRLLKISDYGPMRSCIPPITIPAWLVMATGKSPGELGIYGFRYRKFGEYDKVDVVDSSFARGEQTIWSVLGKYGYRSVVVGVPPSYPAYPVRGYMVSDFTAPVKERWTWPVDLGDEIEREVGEYIFDVEFRKEDKDSVWEGVLDMTDIHFETVYYLLTEKDWQYFQFVEIGLDRVHHAFWKDRKRVVEYYKILDKKIGRLLSLIDLDEVGVAIVSDHGAQEMEGVVAVNQLLIEEGLLSVEGDVKPGTRLKDVQVRWEDTIAWAWGGYYSRVFVNLKGREKKGIVRNDPAIYESVRLMLKDLFEELRGPNGEKWKNYVFFPEKIYGVTNGYPPDLMVFFNDLKWRAIGSIGYDSIYGRENDTGPDDAVHSMVGVFALHRPGQDKSRKVSMDIMKFKDVVLEYFGVR